MYIYTDMYYDTYKGHIHRETETGRQKDTQTERLTLGISSLI